MRINSELLLLLFLCASLCGMCTLSREHGTDSLCGVTIVSAILSKDQFASRDNKHYCILQKRASQANNHGRRFLPLTNSITKRQSQLKLSPTNSTLRLMLRIILCDRGCFKRQETVFASEENLEML